MRFDMLEVLDRLGYGDMNEAFERDDQASKDRRRVMRMTFDIAYTPLDDDDVLYEPMNDPNNIYEGLVNELDKFIDGITLVDSKMEDITGRVTEACDCESTLTEDIDDIHVTQISFDIAWNPELHPEIVDEFIEDVKKLEQPNKLEILGHDRESIDHAYKNLDDMYDKDSFNEGKKRLTYRDRTINEADQEVTRLYVEFQPYDSNEVRKGRITGSNKIEALKKLVDRVDLGIGPDDIDYIINEEHGDFDTVLAELIDNNGGDCLDYIFVLENKATGEKYIDEKENWDYDFDESLNEAKKELPIRKALTDANIMAGLDKDPIAAIKKAIAAVESSADVSEADKNKFKREMTTGSLNKRLSTLATYAYDINKATLK